MDITKQAPGVQKVFPILVGWVVFFLALATLSRLLTSKSTSGLIAGGFDALSNFYKGINPTDRDIHVGAGVGPPIGGIRPF